MQYKNFKNEISLSRLGMGAMRLPTCGSSADIDYEKAQATIRLMSEIAKGRRSGEEEGWLSVEEVEKSLGITNE